MSKREHTPSHPQDEIVRSLDGYRLKLPSKNRYDYYLAAARALTKTPIGLDYRSQPPTEPAVRYLERNRKALDLLIQGTRRPQCFLPYTPALVMVYDELVGLRQLARLLSLRIRDDLAHHQTKQALHHFQVAMRFVRDVQSSGTCMHYGLGNALELLVSAPLREHIDLFSAEERSFLVNLLGKMEAEPEPLLSAVQREFERLRNHLLEHRDAPPGDRKREEFLLALLSESDESDSETTPPKQVDEAVLKIVQDPVACEAFFARALQRLDQYSHQLMKGLCQPWSAQSIPPLPKRTGDLVSVFVSNLISHYVPDLNHLLSRALRMRTERRHLMHQFAQRADKLRSDSVEGEAGG